MQILTYFFRNKKVPHRDINENGPFKIIHANNNKFNYSVWDVTMLKKSRLRQLKNYDNKYKSMKYRAK